MQKTTKNNLVTEKFLFFFQIIWKKILKLLVSVNTARKRLANISPDIHLIRRRDQTHKKTTIPLHPHKIHIPPP